MSITEATDGVGEPTSYSEVISCDDYAKWLITMNEEIESLNHNGTWVLVKPRSDKKIVGCKWIFKKKKGILGVENVRYKA